MTLISSGVIGGLAAAAAVGVVVLDVEAAEVDDPCTPPPPAEDPELSSDGLLDTQVELEWELEEDDVADPDDERVLADANEGFEALGDTFVWWLLLLLVWDIEFERECTWWGNVIDVVVVVVVVGGGIAWRSMGRPK